MAVQPLTRGRLRRLAEVRPAHGRVLSVFLNLDPAEFATPPARTSAVTSVLTDAAHRIDEAELDHADRQTLKGDLERVERVLRGDDLAVDGTHGVAVYAAGEANLLEVVRLPHPIESRVAIEPTPFVEPLLTEADGERWCVLLASRRSARIFAGPADRLEETDRLQDDVHRQHDQGGWSQSRYQRGVEKEKDDHLDRTATVLFDAFKLRPFDRLLVGAPGELVGAVETRLHPYLRERCVGRLSLDVEHATLEEVRRHAAAAAETWARECEREALDRLAAGVGRGDRGAAGLPDVLEALNQARVETLLLAPGLAASGFRDPRADLLSATGGAGLEPVDDVVEAAVEKALEQAAGVLVVRYHDDLGPLDGIGAVLRY